MESVQPESKIGKKILKSLFTELTISWLIVIIGSRLASLLSGVPFLGDNLSLITAALLLYTPLFFQMRKREKIKYFDSTFLEYKKSILLFLLFSAFIFPLIIGGNHLYNALLFHKNYHTGFIQHPLDFALFEILVVALPEEFFFRGYMQNRLNTIWKKKWKLLGVSFGPALPIVSLIFAVSHSLIQYQWWHLFIFFPSLVFGWLYEKRGTITAPLLFHASSNLFAQWVFVHYR